MTSARQHQVSHAGIASRPRLGRWIYSFVIKPNSETRKIVREVNVDADRGTIVSLEVECDDGKS